MRPRTLPPGTVRWTEYDGGRYVFGVLQNEDGETRTAAVLLEVVAPPGNEVAARIRRQIAEALMRDQGRELEEERPDEPRLPFGHHKDCRDPWCASCAEEVQP